MSSLRDQLQTIYDSRGELTPQIVCDEAKNPRHPLHARVYDCKPAVAAERYYLQRAHELIQSVKITYIKNDRIHDVRAFQAIRGDSGFTYKPTEEVIHDPILTELVRREMERDWQQLKARYECFAEFASMVQEDLRAVS